jgi:hypothetical protein
MPKMRLCRRGHRACRSLLRPRCHLRLQQAMLTLKNWMLGDNHTDPIIVDLILGGHTLEQIRPSMTHLSVMNFPELAYQEQRETLGQLSWDACPPSGLSASSTTSPIGRKKSSAHSGFRSSDRSGSSPENVGPPQQSEQELHDPRRLQSWNVSVKQDTSLPLARGSHQMIKTSLTSKGRSSRI